MKMLNFQLSILRKAKLMPFFEMCNVHHGVSILFNQFHTSQCVCFAHLLLLSAIGCAMLYFMFAIYSVFSLQLIAYHSHTLRSHKSFDSFYSFSLSLCRLFNSFVHCNEHTSLLFTFFFHFYLTIYQKQMPLFLHFEIHFTARTFSFRNRLLYLRCFIQFSSVQLFKCNSMALEMRKHF